MDEQTAQKVVNLMELRGKDWTFEGKILAALAIENGGQIEIEKEKVFGIKGLVIDEQNGKFIIRTQ